MAQIKSIYQRYNPSWAKNPQQRMRSRYGDERTGLPPSKLYSRTLAARTVRHSSVLAKRLVEIHRKIMMQQPDILVGILNGAFSRSHAEVRCNQAPYASGFGVRNWRSHLSKIRKTRVKLKLKTISELDNSMCCVINPFGEAYPEKITAPNTLPAYELVKEYIFLGGVFVSCGGMPFAYYFDVVAGGNLKNTSTILPNYPLAFRFVTVQGTPQIQVLGTTLLMNNLAQRDFGAMPLMDDPASNRIGPFPLPIFQNSSDTRFWNCKQLGNTLCVFRPMDSLTSLGAIPVVRAQILGRDVFPVAFVRYGFGILYHIGLDLDTGRNSEHIFSRKAVSGLLQNYLKYFN